MHFEVKLHAYELMYNNNISGSGRVIYIIIISIYVAQQTLNSANFIALML